MDIIVKVKFGSHLYGTATENSDLDYKGVFMPTIRNIFLNRIPKSDDLGMSTKKDNHSKNTKDDIDADFYSLHYFIKLACEGQTVALDILHAPDNMIEETSEIWKKICENKHLFYTRNLSAFIGYARRQAAKYGIKGTRLSDAKKVVEFLKERIDETTPYRLSDFWDILPTGEHIHNDIKDPNELRLYQVCGKQFQETSRIDYVLPILEKFYDSYGDRAKKAERNEGIDFKAVSHAIRAAIQVKQILTENTITFPLKDADLILQIKNGELDYLTKVVPLLEGLMEEVEQLSLKSNLPETVDRNFWDNFLYNMVKDYVSIRLG